MKLQVHERSINIFNIVPRLNEGYVLDVNCGKDHYGRSDHPKYLKHLSDIKKRMEDHIGHPLGSLVIIPSSPDNPELARFLYEENNNNWAATHCLKRESD